MGYAAGFIMAALALHLPLTAAAEGRSAVEVTVRIHDYASVSARAITDAQRFVADLYAAAGVGMRWAPPLRHSRKERTEQGSLATEDLTVFVLSRWRVDHYRVPRDTLGFAAVAEGGGRIAYVLYDRVEAAARLCRCPTMDLMGLVVAHEIGHLLLPRGSHSQTGLMRKKWHVDELRAIDGDAVRFTTSQADLIRWRLSFGTTPVAP